MNISTAPQPDTIPRKAGERSQTILLVDGYGTLSNLIWCQLTALGYRVLTASEESEAQDILLGYGPENIDLLIANPNMPPMRGDEFAVWFQREHPGAKVLLMSNHVPAGEPGSNIGFLQTPFRIETLGEQVREFLESHTDAPQKKAA